MFSGAGVPHIAVVRVGHLLCQAIREVLCSHTNPDLHHLRTAKLKASLPHMRPGIGTANIMSTYKHDLDSHPTLQ
jgi:hypothetical protein